MWCEECPTEVNIALAPFDLEPWSYGSRPQFHHTYFNNSVVSVWHTQKLASLWASLAAAGPDGPSASGADIPGASMTLQSFT